jgi:Zn-dependent protease
MNLLLISLATLLAFASHEGGHYLTARWLGVLAVWVTLVNFVIGGFNLLPLPGSDGMRALALLRHGRYVPKLGDTVLAQTQGSN